jgi:hypothetical protein
VQGPADPVTKYVPLHVKPEFLKDESEQAVEIREALNECQVYKALKFNQVYATRKQSQYLRLSMIMCMGDSIVVQQDEKKLRKRLYGAPTPPS